MGINILSIEQRYYLGHFREGTVFGSAEDYLIDGAKVSARAIKRVYAGRDEKGNKFDILKLNRDFEIAEQDRAELARILEKIKSNPDAQCSAKHYERGRFDRRRFDYFYVTIDGAIYEISKTDAEVAGGLERILRVQELLHDCGSNQGVVEDVVKNTTMPNTVKAAEKNDQIVNEKTESAEEQKLLEKPEDDGRPELIEAKSENETEPVKEIVIEMKGPEQKEEAKEQPKPARGGFHRELLTKPNHANWNQVAGKY